MRKTITTLFALVIFTITYAQQYFPPAGMWERKDLKELKVNKEKLEEAIEFAIEHEYKGGKDMRINILEAFKREPYHEIHGPTRDRGEPAGLIIKDGFLVEQWGDPDRVDMTFSVTKSYLSTVAGLAWDRAMLKVEDQVADYVWDGTYKGEHNQKITWDHLLTQSSDWSGDLFGMPDWSDRPPREGGIDDWKNRELLEPGSNFEYNDVRVNLLAYSLLQVWRKPLPQVLKENLMDKIGASSTWRWYGYDHSWVTIDGMKMQSVSGGGHSGGGVFINTWDHARFGLLFLNDGEWNGEQIISKEWVELIQQPSEANPSYGYMWWLNTNQEKMEDVDERVYYAAGFGGNFIVIVKELDLVIVTRWLDPRELNKMVEKVIDAVD